MNAQRTIDKKRRIRIIQSWELAIDKMPPGLWAWFKDATPDPIEWGTAVAASLP